MLRRHCGAPALCCLSVLVLVLGTAPALAQTTVTIGDEAFGDNAAGRSAAATLDDAWVGALPGGAFSPDLFQGGSGNSGSKTFSNGGFSYQVDWQLGSVADQGPGTPTSTTFNASTGGSVTYGATNAIQASAPSPTPSETRLSATSLSNSELDAIRLDFTNSTTPIEELGIFVGDLESRPNNGTVGRVIVLDPSNNVLSDTPIVYSGTVLNGSPSSYTVTEPTGSPSGPANNNNSTGFWGNQTTAFVSVAAGQPIGSVVIHVGDDDHTNNNTGLTEGLGLVGFQLPVRVFDFGDAPAPYPTLLANNGPRHLLRAPARQLTLGSLVDAEANGQPNATATGDDTNNLSDEDGVVISSPAPGSINIAAAVINPAGLTAQVCGWLDADASNSFDASERQCTNVTSTTTVNLAWAVSSASAATYNARLRVCRASPGLPCDTPTGLAINGEVEDHQFTYNPTRVTLGDFWVEDTDIDELLSRLAGQSADPAALLALLASWEPALAAQLEGADAAVVAAALREYLDPDGDGSVSVVHWETLEELGTVGFYLQRRVADQWVPVHAGLLPALVAAPMGAEYWMVDPGAGTGETHEYRLIEVEARGTRREYRPLRLRRGTD